MPDAAGAALRAVGERLFNDKRLSADGATSCSRCHRPGYAFADDRAIAIGVAGRAGTRNAPSLIGVADRIPLTWDGRRASLESQVLVPFTHSRELGLGDQAQLIERVRSDPAYREGFRAVVGSRPIDVRDIAAALAAYLRALPAGSSDYDRFAAGETSALSLSARRGLDLFRGEAGCSQCHALDRAQAQASFHSAGIGLSAISDRLAAVSDRLASWRGDLDELIAADTDVAALGRFVVTRDPRDIGAYRTPELRNVARTAPYMHDGSVPTLVEAVEREVAYRAPRDARGAAALTAIDRADLVEFLKALTDTSQQ